jgi:hypothetical protein
MGCGASKNGDAATLASPGVARRDPARYAPSSSPQSVPPEDGSPGKRTTLHATQPASALSPEGDADDLMVTSLDESPEPCFEAAAESSAEPRILSTAKKAGGAAGPPLAVLSFQWSQCALLDEVTALLQSWGFVTWDGRERKGGQDYVPVPADWLPTWIRKVEDEQCMLTILLVSRTFVDSISCGEEFAYALHHARHRPKAIPFFVDDSTLNKVNTDKQYAHFRSGLALAQQRVSPGGDWRERLREAAGHAMQHSEHSFEPAR